MICFLSLDSQCQASQWLQIYILKNASDHGHPLFIDSLLSTKEITNLRLFPVSSSPTKGKRVLVQQRVLVLCWKTGTVKLFVVCAICLYWNAPHCNAFLTSHEILLILEISVKILFSGKFPLPFHSELAAF